LSFGKRLAFPMAKARVVDTADTPFSWAWMVGLGVETIDHEVPSQCSASVVMPPWVLP